LAIFYHPLILLCSYAHAQYTTALGVFLKKTAPDPLGIKKVATRTACNRRLPRLRPWFYHGRFKMGVHFPAVISAPALRQLSALGR